MKRNQKRDTRPERVIRSRLHSLGLRFRVNYRIRLNNLSVRPDIVFTRRRVAVFIDGCFWHHCPEHGNLPTRNRDYWLPKLQRNMERDRKVNEALGEADWRVVRAWEHENVSDVVARVVSALGARS